MKAAMPCEAQEPFEGLLSHLVPFPLGGCHHNHAAARKAGQVALQSIEQDPDRGRRRGAQCSSALGMSTARAPHCSLGLRLPELLIVLLDGQLEDSIAA